MRLVSEALVAASDTGATPAFDVDPSASALERVQRRARSR